jgi:hypothetical protein
MSPIDEIIRQFDRTWKGSASEKVRLRIIGSTALMLQANYHRGTKDSDILATNDIGRQLRESIEKHAGRHSIFHKRHRLFFEFVADGLPFLPQAPKWVDLSTLNQELAHFQFEVLDVVDVVVSKLKRFSASDRSDIDAMIERDLVTRERLISRFRAAVDYHQLSAGAADLPRCIANLNQVERDSWGGRETEIELPEWGEA